MKKLLSFRKNRRSSANSVKQPDGAGDIDERIDGSKSNGLDGVNEAHGANGASTNGKVALGANPLTSGYVNGSNGSNGHVNGTKGYTNGSIGRMNSFPTRTIQEDEEEEKYAKADHTDAIANETTIAQTFTQFAQLMHASRRPMPTQTGDGAYVEHEAKGSFLQDLKSLGIKDVSTLTQMIRTKGQLQDDKTMIMERIIQLVAALPTNSKTRADLTGSFIKELWDSLEHPPASYLGDKYKYRQADGSYNNVLYPDWGKACTPYARSVRPETLQPGSLPDPGLIFDAVFARETYREHPNKVSSVLYYWASLIIHDLFQTDHSDFNMSLTSSYLDLSTLYGDVQADQDMMRTFKDGMLKPDCYAEQRVAGMPPGCGLILIMFNRFHNYVAEQLAAINENGRFTKPKDDAPAEKWKKYDNDLFQTARLVTCGLYMNITLGDYLRTIVNLNRSNTTWSLDPRQEMGKTVMGQEAPPRGGGNQVSCEFNLVYRWHSAISAKDEKWTEGIYKMLFGKPSSEVSMPELLRGLHKWEQSMHPDPFKRNYSNLKRGPDGKFSDDELVTIWADSVEDVAGASGANHVPKALRAVEILGMQQARAWDCASLNEFRKFFGLKPHETFEDINDDPKVANALRHLYEHPDFVELYPGLVTEKMKEPMVPGVGICPTYTTSRAILSDAVTLVRSDRFYTTDYHPKNLTNWGYTTVQYDLNIEQGCVFYKLILRAFPNHFKPDSIYVHQPMTVPSENRKIMKTLGRELDYSYDRPSRIPARIDLTSFTAAKYMLERPQEFNVTWGSATGEVMGRAGLNFMLSGDQPLHTKQRQIMAKALYKDKWHQEIKAFYENVTLQLLHDYSAKLGSVNQVDITRDVGNLAHVHFASSIFQLPLKTKDNLKGIYSEHELWMVMCVIFTKIFFDLDPAKSWPLTIAGRTVGQQLGKLIEARVNADNATGWVSGLVDGWMENQNALKNYGVHMVRKLLESGLNAHEIAFSQILPVSTAMVPNQSQVFTQMLDFYLGEGQEHLPEIQRLARLDTEEADTKLLHYAMEGIRLAGTFGSYRRSTVTTTIQDGEHSIPVKPGDNLFCSFVSANRDPIHFPDPHRVRIDRPLESYIHYGIGSHRCLGMEASRVALTAMLKVVGSLKGLRRAPGPQGQLKKIPRPGGFYVYMTENHGSYFPFPTTMKVLFDGELPPVKPWQG